MVSSISLRNKYSNLWSKIYPTINVDAHSFYLIHVLEVTKLFIYFFFLDKNYFFRILLVLSQVHQLHFVWCNLNPVCKQGNAPEWYWGSILNRSLFFFLNCMWFCVHIRKLNTVSYYLNTICPWHLDQRAPKLYESFWIRNTCSWSVLSFPDLFNFQIF